VITGLDHVVVLTGDINAASAAYQTLLARAPSWQYGGGGADHTEYSADGHLMSEQKIQHVARPLQTHPPHARQLRAQRSRAYAPRFLGSENLCAHSKACPYQRESSDTPN